MHLIPEASNQHRITWEAPFGFLKAHSPQVCLIRVSVWNSGRGQKLAGIFMTQPHHLVLASPNQTGTLHNKRKTSWGRCLSSEWGQLLDGLPTWGSPGKHSHQYSLLPGLLLSFFLKARLNTSRMSFLSLCLPQQSWQFLSRDRLSLGSPGIPSVNLSSSCWGLYYVCHHA